MWRFQVFTLLFALYLLRLDHEGRSFRLPTPKFFTPTVFLGYALHWVSVVRHLFRAFVLHWCGETLVLTCEQMSGMLRQNLLKPSLVSHVGVATFSRDGIEAFEVLENGALPGALVHLETGFLLRRIQNVLEGEVDEERNPLHDNHFCSRFAPQTWVVIVEIDDRFGVGLRLEWNEPKRVRNRIGIWKDLLQIDEKRWVREL